MSARYTPLSNPRSAPDAERELEDAFDLDDENEDESNDHESTPLTHNLHNNNVVSPQPTGHVRTATQASITPNSGTYDFERAYDFPPPGSPPPPTSRALPNDFGNSNGLLPTEPVAIPKPRRSLFQRTLGAILPTHYQPVPTTESSHSRPTGGGTENDGVFANVTAKPQAPRVIVGEDGMNYVVPEESQKETPPSYREAQADAVPPYWETTIHAPGTGDGTDLIIDDLPTGSFLIFCLNIFVSFFFQFIGFLLTYLLHTSHAAKFGSRAGLGLTLIQYGFYSRTMMEDETGSGGTGATDVWGVAPPTPTDPSGSGVPQDTNNGALYSEASRDWLSFLFMTLGWFLLLSSIIGYWRVKRWESSVRAPASPQTAAQTSMLDAQMRTNLENAFGIRFPRPDNTPIIVQEVPPTGIPSAQLEREQRLRNDLRAIGF